MCQQVLNKVTGKISTIPVPITVHHQYHHDDHHLIHIKVTVLPPALQPFDCQRSARTWGEASVVNMTIDNVLVFLANHLPNKVSLSSPPLYPASSQWECDACFSSSSRSNPAQGRLRAALSSSEGGFRAALASLLPWKEGKREEKKGNQSSNQPLPQVLLYHHPSVAEERRRLYRSHTLSCPGEEGRRRKVADEGKVGVRLRREAVEVGKHAGSRAEGLWKRGREREQQKRREEEEGRRRRFSVRGSESVGRGDIHRSSKEALRKVKGDRAIERLRFGEEESGKREGDEIGGLIGRRGLEGGRKGKERLRRAISLPSSKHRAGRAEVKGTNLPTASFSNFDQIQHWVQLHGLEYFKEDGSDFQ